MPLIQGFLGKQWMSFAMTEVSGRRSDEFGNLVAVLKLGAVDLDASSNLSKQSFSDRFHYPRFACARGSQKQQVADGAIWGIQTCQKHLVDLCHFENGIVLTDDPATKIALKILGLGSSPCRIERGI